MSTIMATNSLHIPSSKTSRTTRCSVRWKSWSSKKRWAWRWKWIQSQIAKTFSKSLQSQCSRLKLTRLQDCRRQSLNLSTLLHRISRHRSKRPCKGSQELILESAGSHLQSTTCLKSRTWSEMMLLRTTLLALRSATKRLHLRSENRQLTSIILSSPKVAVKCSRLEPIWICCDSMMIDRDTMRSSWRRQGSLCHSLRINGTTYSRTRRGRTAKRMTKMEMIRCTRCRVSETAQKTVRKRCRWYTMKKI